MLSEDFTLRSGAARTARASIRRRLADLGVDDDHVLAVELVVAELMAAAHEACRHGRTHLSLELFPLLTSVRLRCPSGVDLGADELALRERILGRLTVAVGRRPNVDGTVDLWAEVAHPVAARLVAVIRAPHRGEDSCMHRAIPASGTTAVSGLGAPVALALLLPMEAGIPIPIPADLVMLLIGERAADGSLSLWVAIVALEIVAIIGSAALFLIAAAPGTR